MGQEKPRERPEHEKNQLYASEPKFSKTRSLIMMMKNSTQKKVIRLRSLAARADNINSTLKKLLFLGTMTLFAVLALLTLTPGSVRSEACERRRMPKKAGGPAK